MAVINKDLFFMELSVPEKARRVLEEARRCFKGGIMQYCGGILRWVA